MEEFRESVKRGFTACKSDIETLNQENTVLKDKIDKLEDNNSELKTEIKDIKNELKAISSILKEIKLSNTNQNNEQIQQPVQTPQPIKEVVRQPNPVKPTNVKSEDPYEALLAFKAKANKREMLKSKIVSMVNDNGVNLSELKFMFVEHYRYCSKATFYNYLKELELERIIKIERENSKNFVYLYTMKKEV
jgi:septal ring factor EnvC (AmiA/AmiB activator)